jgi:hypothetical protein
MIKGDLHISRRSSHSDLNIPKIGVKVRLPKAYEGAVKYGENEIYNSFSRRIQVKQHITKGVGHETGGNADNTHRNTGGWIHLSPETGQRA